MSSSLASQAQVRRKSLPRLHVQLVDRGYRKRSRCRPPCRQRPCCGRRRSPRKPKAPPPPPPSAPEPRPGRSPRPVTPTRPPVGHPAEARPRRGARQHPPALAEIPRPQPAINLCSPCSAAWPAARFLRASTCRPGHPARSFQSGIPPSVAPTPTRRPASPWSPTTRPKAADQAALV